MNPGNDIEQKPPSMPQLALGKEEKEGAGTTPAQQPEEVEQFQPPQEGAAMERTREQQRTRGLFRRTAQTVCKFMKRICEEETSVMGSMVRAYSPIFKTKTSAALLDMLVQEGPSNPKQVPAMVRYIHQWLMANEQPEYNVYRPLLDLAEAQPADVVMALLRVAPSCDRAAMAMWKSIMCSCRTAEPAMLILLDVLASWPEHSTSTADGDCTAVLALAATVVMWKMLQVPCLPHVVTVHFPRLFVHLLFQVLSSTLDTPEAVHTFWKGCQQQHGLATNPNSFAVQTLKALLCRLHYKDVVVALEDKGAWDTLLCADTLHCAVGVLAREMRHASIALCSKIAFYLLGLLSKDMPCWDLATMAFLVEILECLAWNEWHERVLGILSKNLQSECRDRHRLALTGLLVLGKNISMAIRMWGLHTRLVELLRENDSDVVGMSIILLNCLFPYNGTKIEASLALQLADMLLPLFDSEDSQVQLSSMFIFRDMIDFSSEKIKTALKSHVRRSLLPLSFHCHDENQRVAKTSRAALHSSATFLQRKDLQEVLQLEQTWSFGVLAEDRRRAPEHLRRALLYLDSPQEPLRQAAISFIGMAGRHLRGHKRELQRVCQALEDKAEDISPAIRSQALETAFLLRALERPSGSILGKLLHEFRGARRKRPSLWCCVRLCCWTSEES
ncbi:maestro heat-like repeat-containing protein family member 6 [Oenanthe melanoleuca]|uniref:maestro heat-like repeat-containing protein family member 6 n=1 Tax=Oenanthe melanoleuca TaxID=2939378 RepID=UPI0024C11C04|nr:maestro heat-like repeat-containing protein family member 6 [Oenanthe melanoleuca]